MIANNVEVFPATNTVIIDSVTFNFEFAEASILDGHPMGPAFVLGAARAILKPEHVAALVAAGVPRK